MPIPKTREELVAYVRTSFAKLAEELEATDLEVGRLPCVDGWTVKDLLAVRAWWTESVVEWVEAGRGGAESLDLPAPGYGWHETPRLNADIVERCRGESYAEVRARLRAGCERVLATIETLSDAELLEPGAFAWAGKWPITRWISINTARQYETARTHIRRALRSSPDR